MRQPRSDFPYFSSPYGGGTAIFRAPHSPSFCWLFLKLERLHNSCITRISRDSSSSAVAASWEGGGEAACTTSTNLTTIDPSLLSTLVDRWRFGFCRSLSPSVNLLRYYLTGRVADHTIPRQVDTSLGSTTQTTAKSRNTNTRPNLNLAKETYPMATSNQSQLNTCADCPKIHQNATTRSRNTNFQ